MTGTLTSVENEKRDGSRDPLSYFTPYYNTWKGETGLSLRSIRSNHNVLLDYAVNV